MARKPAILETADAPTDDAPPPIGHNRPQPMTAEQVRAWLDDSCTALTQRRAEILDKFAVVRRQYPKVETAEVQGRIGDFRDILGKFIRACKAQHTVEKKPYLAGGRTVDGFFRMLREGAADLVVDEATGETIRVSIERADEHLRVLQNEFAVRMAAEDRLAAEAEAKRKAEEARLAREAAQARLTPAALSTAAIAATEADRAAKTATARPADLSRISGERSVTSLRTTWQAEIVDRQRLIAAAAGVPTADDFQLLVRWLTEALGMLPDVTVTPARDRIVQVRDILAAMPVDPGANAAYVVPDEVRIRRAIVSDGVRAIPGVRIFEKSEVR